MQPSYQAGARLRRLPVGRALRLLEGRRPRCGHGGVHRAARHAARRSEPDRRPRRLRLVRALVRIAREVRCRGRVRVRRRVDGCGVRRGRAAHVSLRLLGPRDVRRGRAGRAARRVLVRRGVRRHVLHQAHHRPRGAELRRRRLVAARPLRAHAFGRTRRPRRPDPRAACLPACLPACV